MPAKTIDRQRAVELYLAGNSTYRVARLLGCGKTAVLTALVRSGVKVRSAKEAATLSAHRQESHHLWKGGLKKTNGYRVRRQAGKDLLVHRGIAEIILARPLSSGEVVHHANEVRDDNKPINLWVFPSKKAHADFHSKGKVHPQTIFLGAEVVMSYGFPWNHPWKETCPCS